MKKTIAYITSKNFRKWLYGVLIGAIPILTYYGVVEDEIVPHIVAMISASLGFSLATVNTKEEILKEKFSEGLG